MPHVTLAIEVKGSINKEAAVNEQQLAEFAEEVATKVGKILESNGFHSAAVEDSQQKVTEKAAFFAKKLTFWNNGPETSKSEETMTEDVKSLLADWKENKTIEDMIADLDSFAPVSSFFFDVEVDIELEDVSAEEDQVRDDDEEQE